MASIAENLLAFLKATPAISAIAGTRVHYSSVPQETDYPYVWFQRRSTEDIYGCMDDSPGQSPGLVTFDLECCSDNIHQAQSLADAVRSRHRYRGAVGGQTVQVMFVEDQNDDYIPFNMSEQGPHLCALNIEIYLPG